MSRHKKQGKLDRLVYQYIQSVVRQELENNRFNVSKTAKVLGVSRITVYKYLSTFVEEKNDSTKADVL